MTSRSALRKTRTQSVPNVRTPNDPDPSPAHSESSSSPDEAGNSLQDSESLAYGFLSRLLALEGVLALVGLAAGVWSGVEWTAMASLSGRSLLLGGLGGLGLVGIHLILLFPGGARNPLYRFVFRPIWDAFLSRLPDFSLVAIALIAVASGGAEEIFFRGWLQTQTNIVVASVVFGLCHIWGKEGIPYGLYATGMGFALGVLFEHTGHNLWAPALAHGINNFLGLLALKYGWFSRIHPERSAR